MKREELNELIVRALSEDLSESERLVIESGLISDSPFDQGFADRVMDRIGHIPGLMRPNFNRLFYIGFNRVALTGAAAILILTLSLLLSQGSLSYDTLLGIDNQVDDSLVSLLID